MINENDGFNERSIQHKFIIIRELLKELYFSVKKTELEHKIGALLHSVMNFIKIMENTDVDMLPKSILNELEKIAYVVYDNLNNYESFKEEKYLIAVESSGIQLKVLLDDLLEENFGKDYMPFKNVERNIINLTEISKKEIEEKRKAILNETQYISSKMDELNKTIKEQSLSIDRQKKRLDNAISQFQKQFSEAEHRRGESFEKILTNQRDRLDDIRARLEEEVDSFISNKKDDVSQEVDTMLADASNKFTEVKSRIETALVEYQEEGLKAVEDIWKKQEEAKKILGVIGNIGFAGNYSIAAREEKKIADILRGIALVLMLTGVGFIVWLAIHLAEDGLNWNYVLARIGAAVVLFVPAFYVAKQSSWHRRNELRNRKMELELASIGPFLELLPDEKKVEIKANLTEKLFAQPEELFVKGDILPIKSLLGTLEKLVDKLTQK